jgi:hypothetical protein
MKQTHSWLVVLASQKLDTCIANQWSSLIDFSDDETLQVQFFKIMTTCIKKQYLIQTKPRFILFNSPVGSGKTSLGQEFSSTNLQYSTVL